MEMKKRFSEEHLIARGSIEGEDKFARDRFMYHIIICIFS